MHTKIRSTAFLVVVLGAMAFLPLPTCGQSAAEAERMLQKAIQKEMVDGDLPAAVAQYKKIIAGRGVDRAVAAKALFQMGQCYEKLGQAEARKTYERVLREYPDQRELVAQVRARLAALGGAPLTSEKTGPVLTELRLPSGQEPHALSPDGTKVAYTSAWQGTPRTANLMVRDVVSGAERQMTHLK